MTKQKMTDAYLDFKYHFVYISKVIMYELVLILMIAGVILIYQFVTHSTLQFKYNPTVISPVPESTQSAKGVN